MRQARWSSAGYVFNHDSVESFSVLGSRLIETFLAGNPWLVTHEFMIDYRLAFTFESVYY